MNETVLGLRNERDDDVTFDLEDDDEMRCHVVRIDRPTWEAMGSPSSIVVTVAARG